MTVKYDQYPDERMKALVPRICIGSVWIVGDLEVERGEHCFPVIVDRVNPHETAGVANALELSLAVSAREIRLYH